MSIGWYIGNLDTSSAQIQFVNVGLVHRDFRGLNCNYFYKSSSVDIT